MGLVGLVFAGTLMVGVPIAFVLGISGVLHALLINEPQILVMMPQRMFAGCDNFSLMAIPLFVLAGELMSFGGVTQALSDMARSLVGHVRGGLAYTTVIVGTMLGALLGAANASSALLSDVLYPEMVKEGYEESFTASLISATSILGPIIPPSMVFVMYGVTANISIGKLFFAGIIPGLLIAAAYFVVIWIIGRREEWKVHPRSTMSEVAKSTIKAIPALFVPLVIMGGIIGGITTPTEAAATASVVAIVLGAGVYRKLKLKHIPHILLQTGIISGACMIIVAMGNLPAWTLALEQVPQKITQAMLSLTTNKYVMLLVINLLLLMVGMVMETFAAIIILVPVLLPVINSLGIDPLHFGLVVCVNLILGLITPPVGGVLFTTGAITKVSMDKLVVSILPWVAAVIAVLLLITYFPGLVTFLPNLLF